VPLGVGPRSRGRVYLQGVAGGKKGARRAGARTLGAKKRRLVHPDKSAREGIGRSGWMAVSSLGGHSDLTLKRSVEVLDYGSHYEMRPVAGKKKRLHLRDGAAGEDWGRASQTGTGSTPEEPDFLS